MKSVRTRFAPSPTGYLHLGHAFSALTACDLAQAHGGQFILRIEDIDHTRCRPQYEQAIYDDLAWLGLSWEMPVLRQSDHLAEYQAALDRLKDLGVLYADARTRKGQAEAALGAPQGEIDVGTGLAAPAWRLSLQAARAHLGSAYETMAFHNSYPGLAAAEAGGGAGAADGGGKTWVKATPETNGDVILGRKDIGVAYHLAVVIDDARQGITHVVRGHDLFDATHTQVLLQALLGLPTPTYLHHQLLLDDQGRRLAKRKGSKALRDYRGEGLTPKAVQDLIATTPKA